MIQTYSLFGISLFKRLLYSQSRANYLYFVRGSISLFSVFFLSSVNLNHERREGAALRKISAYVNISVIDTIQLPDCICILLMTFYLFSVITLDKLSVENKIPQLCVHRQVKSYPDKFFGQEHEFPLIVIPSCVSHKIFRLFQFRLFYLHC